MLSRHTLEDETVPDSHAQTHACTHTALFWARALCSHCALRPLGHTLGITTGHSQSSSPQHKLRSESRQIFVQGRLRLVLVTRNCKHHEAASPSTSKEHRQVSSLHIPPEQLQKPSSATTIFWSPLSATRPLQGTGRILLDELLVTGIADALGVNARREGQLIR